MRDPASLAGLLSVLLSLPEGRGDAATRSLRPWLGQRSVRHGWPPRDRGGLWLIDTRDRRSRWRSILGRGEPDAVLVLSGSGVPGTPLRRALRRVRRPGTRRVGELRTRSAIEENARGFLLRRLAFHDGLDVPTSFEVTDDPGYTGAAFLLTRRPAFTGALWSFVGEQLRDPDLQVLALHLRTRGAAVIKIRAADQLQVIRIVPDPLLQLVVRKNHHVLKELRTTMAADAAFARLTPEPMFDELHGSVLVSGESSLPGTLAWKVASGALQPAIYRNALHFLQSLRNRTISNTCPDGLARLFREDEERLAAAGFVDEEMKRLIGGELRSARKLLGHAPFEAYASHGDFGYGNIFVDPSTGELLGVIDWDTARKSDFPGIDRVNLEIQLRAGGFAGAIEAVWRERKAHEALGEEPGRARALFGVAVCRFIMRSFHYPSEYRERAAEYTRALRWLAGVQ